MTGDDTDDSCEVPFTTFEVADCAAVPATESVQSAATNIAKAIVGAGSFALPFVFEEEGVLGATISLVLCGALASTTMKSLVRSRRAVGARSYVDLAGSALGDNAAIAVFALTLCASLGSIPGAGSLGMPLSLMDT